MAGRTAEKGRKGVYRLAGSSTYRVRRQVPSDVRVALKRSEWDVSLRTDSALEADRRATDLHSGWDREIRRLRTTAPETLDVEDAKRRLVAWSWCAHIADVVPEWEGDDPRQEGWRRPYPPNLDLTPLPALALVVGQLQRASEIEGAWEDVRGFDAKLGAALAHVEITATPETPGWADLRIPFAEAWRRSLLATERGRMAGAARETATRLRDPDQAFDLPTLASPQGYAPQVGDKTVADLIASYRADRSRKHGEKTTETKYGHIFRSLEELMSPATPLRSVTRDDCKRIRDQVRRLPANASKKWPRKTLLQAIEAAEEDEKEHALIAPNTVNSYMSRMIAIFNYAIEETWITTNPAARLVDPDMPTVRRRAFTADELTKIVTPLKGQDERFWTVALLIYTGCRAAEIAQLRRSDIKSEGEITYLDLSVFDDTGRRTADKRLKTAASARVVPLHPELIAAGFLEFVAASDDERLFTWKPGPTGAYSHWLSRWFAEHKRDLKMTDPATVLHSTRHGFSDACERAGLLPRIRDSLGGWSLSSQGDRYGKSALGVLAEGIGRLEFEGFRLP